MLAKHRVLKRCDNQTGRRSRLGARVARAQSIIVYVENETQPIGQSDVEIVRRSSVRGIQLSNLADHASRLGPRYSGSFLARMPALISSDSLSLFRK